MGKREDKKGRMTKTLRGTQDLDMVGHRGLPTRWYVEMVCRVISTQVDFLLLFSFLIKVLGCSHGGRVHRTMIYDPQFMG